MSEEQKSVGDANASVGDQDLNSVSSAEQKVSYETYKRTLDEAKKTKATLKEMQEQLSKINEEKLLAEGKKDELLKAKEKELSEIKSRLERERAESIITRVQSRIAEVATKLGAYDSSDVIKNISLKDLNLDDEGNFEQAVLESKVDALKKQKNYLFKKENSQVIDGNPVTRPQALTKETLKGVPLDDLIAIYNKT
jgi:hypothetical protein